MRVFIAVDLPAGVKKAAGKIQEKLKEAGADVGWVAPEKFHFTLKFIGEMAEEKIGPLADKMTELVKDEKSFPVSLAGIGAFPSLEKMRVIWLGADRGVPELKKMAAQAEQAALSVGAAPEVRSFSGHLTLGRVRSFQKSAELKKIILAAGKMAPLDFTVGGVKIFRSVLKSTGSEYSVLREINFRKENSE